MKCVEAWEFLSAIYDGEKVPPEAAQHTAHCADCRELLKGYAETGAALRSYGSLLLAQPVRQRLWLTPKRTNTTWWQKGFQMMRIPRIALASLVLLLLVLGSRLALVEVRAHDDGSVLNLTLTPAQGQWTECYLSTTDKTHDTCGGLRQLDNNNLTFAIRALKKDGARVLLSIRSRVTPLGPAGYGPDTENTLPETQAWFTPGEPLAMPGTGDLKVAMTGEWTDHIPVGRIGSNQLLDPGPTEIRLSLPVLLKNNKVVGDLFSAMSEADQSDECVYLYIPGEGRFLLSLTPVQGAVPAKVNLSRISFESNGERYVILTGMPVSRAENIWVLHDAAYKPKPDMTQGQFLGAGPTNKLL